MARAGHAAKRKARPKARPKVGSGRELQRVRQRLAEAEETLAAIRSGDVDAIAVDGPQGRQIFTLQSADQPYRVLAERMSEGAASLTADGTILFCNERLAEMVGESPEKLRGSSIASLFAPEHNVVFRKLLARGLEGESRGEVTPQRRDGTRIPALASLRMIAVEKARGVCLLLTDLSAIKQADDAIRSQAALHATMLATSSDGFWIFDEQARLLEVNDVYCRMSGYSREELLRMHIADIDAVKDADNIAAHIRRVTESGFDRFETVHRRKDGSTFDVEISVSFWREKRQLLLFARDISERKHGEEANLRLASIVRSSDDGIVAKTLDGIITSWNEGAEKIYGYPAREAVGRSISLVVPPDRRRELEDMLEKIRHGIEVPHFDSVRVRKDGQRIDVSITSSPIKDSAGNVLGVSTIVREITRQKNTEQQLRKASLYARSLIEASLDPLVTISREGKIIDVNEATENATGIRRDRLIGSDFSDYFTEPEKARKGYQEVFAEGFVRDYPLAIRHSSGQVMEVLYNASVFRNEKGQVEGVFAAARDISEQRRAERKLKEASRYTRSLIEASLDPLVTISQDGKIRDVNVATEKTTGIAREHLIGSDFSEYFAEPEKARQGYERVFAEGFVRDYPLSIRHSSGSVMDVLYNATVFKNEHGEVEGVFAAARDITERKRAEEKLREASLYTRSLIEASLDPLVTISRDGKITDVNQATETATGVSRDRLLGSEFCNYFTEPKKAHEGYQQVFATGYVRDYPLALRHTSGRVIDVLYNASVFKNEHGEAQGVFAAARDITDRKRAEQKLAEQAALLDLAQDAIIVSDLDSRVLFWSRGAKDMYGWDAGEAMGEVTRGFLHTEFPTSVDSILLSLKQEREWEGELGHTCRDGKRIIVASRWSLLRDAEGNPTAILEINRDITERKQAEAKLREASLYTRSLIEASLDPLVTISQDGKITDVNEATEKATGISREKLIGSEFPNYFTEPEKARAAYEEVFAKGFVHDYPLAIRHSSGKIMDVLSNASVFRDETGAIKGVFAAARDVTERKQAQEQLRKASLYTRSLIEASLDPLVTISQDGKITDVNEATEKATGISREKLIGSEFFNYFTEPEKARQGYKKVFDSGFVCDYPLALRHTSGRVMDVLYNASVFENENGEVEGVFAAARDVTERKAAEEQVRRLNNELEQRVLERTVQLEAANKELEAFTYSVAHDLRAPLRHISGFSKILTEEFGSGLPPDAQHHLQRISDGTRRMGVLVDDLLNLARIGRRELASQVCGLRSIVDEVIQELKAECEGRAIEWKIGSLPFVECDPGLMKQVFQNLIANALKFTRPRSPAVIEVGQQEEDGTPVIYVRDNGVGFSMKYADKLFGVFQRLHRSEDFEGTGVGLATVQRIIHKHGGSIRAEAELDKGATFYFTLARPGKAENHTKAVAVGDRT